MCCAGLDRKFTVIDLFFHFQHVFSSQLRFTVINDPIQNQFCLVEVTVTDSITDTDTTQRCWTSAFQNFQNGMTAQKRKNVLPTFFSFTDVLFVVQIWNLLLLVI